MEVTCKKILLLSVLFLGILSGCSQEKARVKGYVYDIELVPIRGGNKRAALYRFSYNDSTYSRVYEYSKISKWHYLVGDSIWVTVSNNNPRKSKPDTIFFRPQVKELAIPSTNDSNRVITYRSIAAKPLFPMADNDTVNESSLQEYVYTLKSSKEIKAKGKVFVDIIVSKSGKITATLLKSSENNELDSFVIETLLSLPAGRPGINKNGEPERVGLLMEFDFK